MKIRSVLAAIPAVAVELAWVQLLRWIGLGGRRSLDRRARYGKANEHNHLVPRDHWLEEREKENIIAFDQEYPLGGYRRLAFMMLDRDIVGVSPSSVYNNVWLHSARGCVARRNQLERRHLDIDEARDRKLGLIPATCATVLSLLCALHGLLLCPSVTAQVTNDDLVIGTRKFRRIEFKANAGGFEVNQRANLAILANRNFIAAWHEGGPTDCYASMFDQQGNTVGGIFTLHPFGSSGWQYGPSPAALPDGGIVAAWGGASSYVDAQKFDNDRAPVGGEITVANINAWPAVAAYSNGEFVVAFGTPDAPVQARRYNTAGVAGNLFQVGAFVSGWFHPSVAYGPDGRFTIAWPAAGNIRARSYASNEFSPFGPEFIVNTTNASQCYYPSVAYNSSNELLVVWSGAGPTDSTGVFARRYAANGAPLSPEFLVNESTNGSQSVPNASIGPNGEIFVAWQSSTDVYGRLFDRTGLPVSHEFRVNRATAGTQEITPHAGMHGNLVLDNGNLVVGWAGDGPAGGGVYLTMLQLLYDADIRITNQPVSVETLAGGAATFAVGASSAEPLNYQWQFNGSNLPNATNASFTLNNVQFAQAGSYHCVITNSILARTSSVASLSVLQNARCCGQLYELGYRTNGVFVIDPDGPGGQAPISVECLMTLAGGSWEKLTAQVATSALNTDTNKVREYLYVQNGTGRYYRSPLSQLVWDWNSGKDLYGVYSYSTGGPEGTFTVSPSGERQLYGVGGSSGPFANYKCLIYYTSCKDPATAQVQLCQDRPGIFGGACQCGVTVYIRECLPASVWTLQLTVSPTNGGTLTGAGAYADGASAAITATANPGYRFSHWAGVGVADTNAAMTTVLMTQSRSVTGVFVKTWTLTLNVDPPGSGMVTGNGTYDSGTSASITAEPLAANRFLYWEGSGITDTNAEVTSILMDRDRVVTAHFTAPDLAVTNIIVPAGAIAGHIMQASWTLTNVGPAAAIGTWSDHLWLSPDNQIGGDTEIALYPISSSVFVNGSLTRVQNVPIPASLSGNYWLVVQANSDRSVAELNYSNNYAISPHPILIANLPCPNLQVSTVFAPSNVFAGQQTVIEWVVTNAGPASTASADWRDAVYLSTDSQFDAGDQLLCTSQNASALAANGSYFSSCAVQIPHRIQGPRYVIVRTDYQNRVNECGLDGDNVGVSRVMQIDIGRYPDLQVAKVDAPFDAFSGQSATITWAVTNAGPGATEEGFWYDTVYYSTNSTFVPSQALASFPHSSVLATGQIYTATQQVTLPVGVFGTNFHFFVQTDSGNGAWEYVFENNNLGSTARATDVHLTPPPDLEICDVLVPAITHAGADFSVTYCVTNRGANATPNYSWQEGFYLSSDTNLDTQADTYLGSAMHYGSLQRNEGYAATFSLRMPASANGPRYVIVVADNQNSVFELNKTNNHSASAATVNILGLADLRPETLTAPPTALAGFDFTVNYRVTNAGPCPTLASSWVDSFYLSTDQTLDTQADTSVGEVTHAGALDISGSYQGTATLHVPIGLTGNRYLFVVTDRRGAVPESNEGNNTLLSATPIRLDIASNDLSVAAIGLPSNAVAGFTFTATYIVTNSGLHLIPNSAWRDVFYLSLDQVPDTNDWFLGEFTRNGNLAANGSYTNTVSFRLPAGTAGDFRLFVATDSRSEVFELNESNNVALSAVAMRILSIPPDLAVESCQAGSSAIAGTSVPVSWTVRNGGPGRTTVDDWHDRIILSSDMIVGNAGDITLAEFAHTGGLNPQESYSRPSEAVTLPRSTAAGGYFIFVEADSRHEVYESTNDGSNFCLAGSITVIRPDVDLNVTNLVVASEAYSGQSLSVAWTVRNLGNTPAAGNGWQDHVYLSRTPEVTTNAILLGAVPRTTPLGPAASYTVTNSFSLPWDIAGDFYVIVRADGTDVINESIEENNDRASAVPTYVYLSPTPDLILTSISAPETALSGQPAPVSWSVLNFGAATTERWYDSVFLSLDAVFDRDSDIFLGYLEHTGGLDEGTSYNVDHAFDIPPGLYGLFYVFVITDSRDRVYERGGEANNVAHSAMPVTINLPPLSDFVVTSVTPPTGQFLVGTTATVSYTVFNQSANPVNGRWEDTIYLSSDPIWDVNDPLLARVAMNRNIGAWESYNQTINAPIPGVVPGSYYVIVRSDIRNQVLEADEGNNLGVSSGTVALDMIEIPLNGSRTNRLSTGTEHYYKVITPTGEVLAITLDSTVTNGSHELFTRFAQVPSRAQWDFAGSIPFFPDQQVIVPQTQQGNYLNLVRGQDVPNPPANYKIQAELRPFEIRSVNPSRIGDNGQVTLTLKGARFAGDATVVLEGDHDRLGATKVTVPDGATLTARFFLTNAPHGVYSISVSNRNSSGPATLANAVTIETATGIQLQLETVGNLTPRVGTVFETTGLLINKGNIDIPYAVVLSSFNVPATIGWSRPPQAIPSETNFPGINWLNRSPTAAFFNGATRDLFYLRDLHAGAEVPFTMTARGFPAGPFQVEFSARGTDTQSFLEDIFATVEGLRLSLLQGDIHNLPSDLLSAIADPMAWRALFIKNYNDLGLVDQTAVNPLGQFAMRKSMSSYQCSPLYAECLKAAEQFLKDCWDACDICQSLPESPREICDTLYDWLSHFDPLWRPNCRWYCTYEYGLRVYACINDNCTPVCRICVAGQWQWVTCRPGETYLTEHRTGCGQATRPIDPNEKIGPSGFGPAKFIAAQEPLPYTIYFENLPVASAVTREIRVVDRLGAALDPRSVRLREIGFGSFRISVPPDQSFYQTRVALGPTNNNLLADIAAFVDVQAREIRWTSRAIDPSTGELPESAQLGLLLPNDGTHRGEGFVSYTVLSTDGLATGTLITNTATIVFDNNEPFDTAPVWNTLDSAAPTSAVAALPPVSLSDFSVTVTGLDDLAGSGLQSMDIYVSDSGGPFQLWLAGVTASSVIYAGQPGHTYRFYSRAHDNVGNVEDAPPTYDAETTLLPTVPDQVVNVGETVMVTNSVPGLDSGLTWGLLPGAPTGARINTTNGVFSWTPQCTQGSSTNIITVLVTNMGSSSVARSFTVIVPECVEVGLGSTAVRVGQQGCVTNTLFSTVDLTNLTFTVEFPSNRFSSFAASVHTPPGSSGEVLSVTVTSAVIRLSPPSGQFFRGPLRVGEICCTANTGLPSAFVELRTKNVAGRKPDGTLVGNAFGLPGRIAVVADRPLLEAARGTNSQRDVVIYAPTRSTNVLQFVTRVTDTNWQDGWEIIQTNLVERFTGAPTNPPDLYLRTKQK